MAITLVEAVGAANSNTYATLVEAEAYMETLVFKDDWANEVNDEHKKAVLVQAARLMDTLRWKGTRSYPLTQALAWPRANVTDREGFVIPSTTLPAVLKNAQCEFALRLLGEDRAADAGGLVPESASVGSISIGRMNRNMIPDSVMDLIQHLTWGDFGSSADLVRS